MTTQEPYNLELTTAQQFSHLRCQHFVDVMGTTLVKEPEHPAQQRDSRPPHPESRLTGEEVVLFK